MHFLKRAMSGVVTLVGWAALFGTSSTSFHWDIESEPVPATFEVAPLDEGVVRFVMRIEGHPEMLDAAYYLRIEEPGRDLVAPDAGTLDLPLLDAEASASVPMPTPLEATPHQGRSNSGDWHEELRYFPGARCSALPCEIDLVLRARATDAPYVRAFTFTAGAMGFNADEPPPGRVFLTRTVAP